MANDYFSGFTRFIKGALARAENLNTVFDQVETGLDKLPSQNELNRDTRNYAVDTGAADAYVITLAHVSSSYQNGQKILFLTANANTGASTLNVSGISADAIVLNNGDALPAGVIAANSIVEVRRNATGSNWQLFGVYDITSTVSAFIATLLDDTTAAAARTTLGALSKTDTDTATGNLTFNGTTNAFGGTTLTLSSTTTVVPTGKSVSISTGGILDILGNFRISSVNVDSSALQLNYVNVTAGTAAASKALVLDSSKNIAAIGTIESSDILVKTANAEITLEHTGASADEQRYREYTSSGDLIFAAQNDAESVESVFLRIARTTTTVDKITLTATDVELAGAVKSTGRLTVNAASPTLQLEESDASADNGNWQVVALTEALHFRTINDAESVATTFMQVDRTGTVLDKITFAGTTIDIADVIVTTANTSAVNKLAVANATTGGGPNLTASGSDTNINLNLGGQGTGYVNCISFGINGTVVSASAAELDYNNIAILGDTQVSKTVTTDSSGNTNYSTGNGIALGGGSDYLNEYIEDTWTPTIQDSSLSDGEGQTYTTQTGRYTRIGNVVYFTFDLVISGFGTLTTSEQGRIGNLPFTASGNSTGCVGKSSLLNITAGHSVDMFIPTGGTIIELFLWDATGGVTAMSLDEISSDGEFHGSGFYFV